MSNQENHIIVRLRISPELRDQIADSAKTHNRSMSADMVVRLEKSFTEQQSINLTRLEEEISRLSAEAREMRMLYIELLSEKNKNSVSHR